MIYRCKFGQYISIMCSDGMQIMFLFTVDGVFWYRFGWVKVLSYEPASVPIFQTYTVLFEISKRYVVINIPVVIWLQQYKYKKMLFSS